MPIGERRQGAEWPVALPDQRQEGVPSSGPRTTRATAILPERIGENWKPLSGQSDAMSDGKLVYAVHGATESKESVSDEMLLKSVAEGDKAAMHIMFARHRIRVFRFIQRMVRNTAIADDLVSQVFLDVWRSANRFEGRARVSTWLLSIARLKGLSSLRRRTYENIDASGIGGKQRQHVECFRPKLDRFAVGPAQPGDASGSAASKPQAAEIWKPPLSP